MLQPRTQSMNLPQALTPTSYLVIDLTLSLYIIYIYSLPSATTLLLSRTPLLQTTNQLLYRILPRVLIRPTGEEKRGTAPY